MNAFTFIDNKIILSINAAERLTVLDDVVNLCIDNFPIIDVEALRVEWDMLLTHINNDILQDLRNLDSIEEFWNRINNCEYDDGRKAFPQLFGLAEIVMCLPNSNAECERQFAIMTDVKDKKKQNGVSAFIVNNYNKICFKSTSRNIFKF